MPDNKTDKRIIIKNAGICPHFIFTIALFDTT